MPGDNDPTNVSQRKHRQSSSQHDSTRPQGLNRRETSRTVVSYNPYDETSSTTAAAAAPSPPHLQPNRRKSTQPLAEHSTSGRTDSTESGTQNGGNVGSGEDGAGWFGMDAEPMGKGGGGGGGGVPPGKAYKEPSPARLVWWLATCAAFVILAPVISIVMGVTLHAREMAYPGDDGLPKFPGRTVDFEIVLISADPKSGSMRMDWRILGEKNSACRPDNLPACTEVEIMFDTNLLRAEGTHSTQEEILSSDPPDRPIFRFNATAFAVRDPAARTPTFRTQLALFSPERKDASLIFYPFDSYTAEIICYARERDTNNTVGVSISKSRGIAVGLETSFDHSFLEDVPPGLVEARILLTRSTLVKSYSIVSTIAIWFITIILALVMITTVFFGFKQRGEVLLIPVATLFAFTQLRQSMPGAPDGFGDIIDLVGLVPCLALLALTAAFSLGAFILTDPTNKPRQIRWTAMRKAFSDINNPNAHKQNGQKGSSNGATTSP